MIKNYKATPKYLAILITKNKKYITVVYTFNPKNRANDINEDVPKKYKHSLSKFMVHKKSLLVTNKVAVTFKQIAIGIMQSCTKQVIFKKPFSGSTVIYHYDKDTVKKLKHLFKSLPTI